MIYKTLPLNFRKNGFDFHQIWREGDKAIYKKTHDSAPDHPSFETIRIKTHDGYVIAGKTVEPAECYPSHEEWGTHGWTYTDLDKAKERFGKL